MVRPDNEKSKREPLEDSEGEVRLRFHERFGDASSAILQTIVDELNHRQALAEFVASDDARTGARTIKEREVSASLRPDRPISPGNRSL